MCGVCVVMCCLFVANTCGSLCGICVACGECGLYVMCVAYVWCVYVVYMVCVVSVWKGLVHVRYVCVVQL